MEFSAILLIIGMILGVYLIFKFIKKLVYAIISLVLFFAIIVAGIFGLVYLDFNQLANTTDFDVDVMYLNSGNYVLGTQFQVKNKSLDFNSVKGLSQSEMNQIKVDEISKDDNLFILTIDNTIFNKLIKNKNFDLSSISSSDAFSSFEMILTGDEVKQIIDSSDEINTFLDIILDKNNVKGILRDAAKPLGRTAIDAELSSRGISLKEVLFLLVLKQSFEDQNSILILLDAYKNGGIEIYPDRFTFKLVRMLPVETIQNNLPNIS